MPRTPKAPTAGIIYRGPSMLDGSPIVAVALYRVTGANRKTGAMVQTYILADNGQSPVEAIRSGADAGICGDCKHRGDGRTYGSRSCYVNVGQGPTAVHKGLARGIYPGLSEPFRSDLRVAMGEGRMVRLGTYGDPAAVPVWVWTDLTQRAAGWTGYTHAWKRSEAAVLRGLCMASADTAEEAEEARAAGWRTFRVREASEPVLRGEFTCPASEEAGKVRTCVTCGACDGVANHRSGRQASPVIVAHGALASRLAANRARTIPLA